MASLQVLHAAFRATSSGHKGLLLADALGLPALCLNWCAPLACAPLAALPCIAVVDSEADMFQTDIDFGSMESEAFTRDVYQRYVARGGDS